MVNKIFASIIGASALLVAADASAQVTAPAPPPQPPAASQTTQAPYTSTNPNQSAAESQPLFHIGQVPVAVWAPVQAPYNSKSNGTQAANALWDVDAY